MHGRRLLVSKKGTHGREAVLHEGPMADTRGTGWRQDAAELEAREHERMENPMPSLPDHLTTIDKARVSRAKSDEGRASIQAATIATDRNAGTDGTDGTDGRDGTNR